MVRYRKVRPEYDDYHGRMVTRHADGSSFISTGETRTQVEAAVSRQFSAISTE